MNPWQPTLQAQGIQVRPLRAEDFEALFRAASDPKIWEQHSDPERYQRERFTRFFGGALDCQGALVVLDRGSGEMIGSSRYYEWNESQRTVVVGYTFLVRERWGDGTNRELKKLMLDHAFKTVDTVLFQVSPINVLSQKALEKLGALYDHDEEVMVLGKMSSRKIFKMTKDRWSTCG